MNFHVHLHTFLLAFTMPHTISLAVIFRSHFDQILSWIIDDSSLHFLSKLSDSSFIAPHFFIVIFFKSYKYFIVVRGVLKAIQSVVIDNFVALVNKPEIILFLNLEKCSNLKKTFITHDILSSDWRMKMNELWRQSISIKLGYTRCTDMARTWLCMKVHVHYSLNF